MGNTNQQKKIPVINKTQLEVASTKARIHLELMRDRKNAQIVRGERQLVAKLKSHSRNKVQQLLIAQRITNGLKYAQACNLLASYAATLKSQSGYIAENVANRQKIQPWLVYIYSLQFAAEHMGLSSLEDFRKVIRSLYDPMGVQTYCNKDVIQLLSPTPSAEEINIYVVEMSERNEIPLEQINIIGHKFTKQWNEVPVELDQHILDMRKTIANQVVQGLTPGNNKGNFPPPNGGQGFGNQGQGFGGNQGQGFGGNQGQGFGGNQGQGGNNGQGFGNQGGFGQGGMGGGYQNYQNNDSNPYEGASNINSGPKYYQPNEYKPSNNNKPNQFTSFEDMLKLNETNNHKITLYPDVDVKEYKSSQYKPVHNPFTPPENQKDHNSPTLSQIMRDFDKKS